MAAPSTVYQTYKTRRRKAGTPDVDVDLYIAKFLQNTTPKSGDNWGDGYFNSTDTEAQKIAKIKDIFKIDGWVQVAKGTATTPEMGFIGYCNSRISGNGLYHKTERFSGVRVLTTAQASAELLNDAGLNAKGRVTSSASTGSRATADLLNNGFKITASFRSAFYNATTGYGIKWRLYLSNDTYNYKSIGTIAPKVKESKTAFSVDVDPIDNLYIEAPNTYEVMAYITNEEGTIDLHLDNVVVNPAERAFYWGNDIYGAWLYGSSDTYLQTRRKMLGSTLYEELVPTPTPVDAGYYVDKIYSESSLGNGYYYVVCNSSGVVTLEGIFSGQLRTTYGHCGYGTTLALALAAADSDADIDISGVHWQSPPYSAYLYSIAYDPNDNKWYNGEAGTTQAINGFYVRGENEFKYYWWQISSGVRVNEGSYGAAQDYEINI